MYVRTNKWNMLFNKKLLLLDSVGFNSFSDFLSSVFVNKGLLLIAGIVAGIVSTIDHFITTNIFDPSKGIWILLAATFLDVLLGISVGVKEKKFDAYKLNRAWIRVVTQIAFVFLMNQVTLVWDMINDWMVNTLLLAFILATVWSAFKNAYKLKWIQPATYEILEKILSIEDIFQTILTKIFKSNNPKKPKK